MLGNIGKIVMVKIMMAKSCWGNKSKIMLGKVSLNGQNHVGGHEQNHDGECVMGKMMMVYNRQNDVGEHIL